MKLLNQQINKAVKLLVDQILKGNLSKRRIDQLLIKFTKKLNLPIEEFKKRVYERALISAEDSYHATLNAAIALNNTIRLHTLTSKDLQRIVDIAMNKELVFTRWKNKNRNAFIYESYTMSDAIDRMPLKIKEDVRKRMMGSYLAGDTPGQMASKLLDRNAGKKLRRNIKTLYTAVQSKAHNLADLEVMIKNEKYIDWVEWRTVGDDAVDEVCVQLEKDTIKMKYKPSELPMTHIPQSHFNCRCKLVPRRDK